jgi:DNA repair photolyase
MTLRILSPTSGFIRLAGFTHSLNPARNCTFGCTYCYVPTMRVFAGLKKEDWERWGQFTTFKEGVADALRRELRPDQTIYCSPVVDPYQPAEAGRMLMPELLREVAARPPLRFVIQTRGPLILRDLDLLLRIPGLRVSFSLTTDDDEVRRRFEPHCASVPERVQVMRTLREAGIEVWAALAPLLPCDPEGLAELAVSATGRDVIGDPLHLRSNKPSGATTRQAAFQIAGRHGWEEWLDAEGQVRITASLREAVERRGRRFLTGPEGFGLLTR